MHAELLVGVAETRGLAIADTDGPDARRRFFEGAGDVAGGGGAGRDLDALRSDFEFVLVEFHGIRAGLHGRRGKSSAGAVGPILGRVVVPMYNSVEAAGGSCCRTGYVATAGSGNVAFDVEIGEEGEIKVSQPRDAAASERESIWTMEPHAVLLGLYMSAVHVEGERGIHSTIVAVDISEERSTGGRFVLWLDKARVERSAADTVDIVIDETLGRIELASSLAVDDKDVGSFDSGGAWLGGRDIAEGVLIR